MSVRVAYSYVAYSAGDGTGTHCILIALSLLLHIALLIVGVDGKYERYGPVLGGATVLAGICAFAFIKDALMWMGQIRTCPRWMWRTALAFGIYSTCILLVQFLLPHDASDNPMPIVTSAFTIPFNAISCCVLYSVLREGPSAIGKSLSAPEIRCSLSRSSLRSLLHIALDTCLLRQRAHPKYLSRCRDIAFSPPNNGFSIATPNFLCTDSRYNDIFCVGG